ncbi:MAG: hypothetical protein L0211_15070 [Planctomycetaceae bacterium]|nr:hypothetical protein [Planctomycetaceae bacterium]
MIRAYDEFVEFIASGPTPLAVAGFQVSQATKDHVADLIRREKTTGLTPEETADLEHYMHLEHAMRLAKARAQSLSGQ